MTSIVLKVFGQPAPQGSKRAFKVRGKGGIPTGRVAVIESSHDRVKSWRQAVIDAAVPVRAERLPFDGPLHVAMSFFLARPQSHFGTGRNAGRLKESAPHYPTKAPDLSKVIRATEDALTDCGIWADDARVVMISAEKQYTSLNSDEMSVPGAIIEVEQIGVGAGYAARVQE